MIKINKKVNLCKLEFDFQLLNLQNPALSDHKHDESFGFPFLLFLVEHSPLSLMKRVIIRDLPDFHLDHTFTWNIVGLFVIVLGVFGWGAGASDATGVVSFKDVFGLKAGLKAESVFDEVVM